MLHRIRSFIRYYYKAVNQYRIHSPVLNDLYHNVINDRRIYYAFDDIELLREKLLKQHKIILEPTPGAKSTTLKSHSIRKITQRVVSSKEKCRFLFRLANWYRAYLQIELGTSLGIATMYLAKANPKATTYTIEGNHTIAGMAQKNFIDYGMNNILLKKGNFDKMLATILPQKADRILVYIDGHHQSGPLIKYMDEIIERQPNSEILFCIDDINWSQDMNLVWQSLLKEDFFQIKVDLFQLGLLFKTRNLQPYPPISFIPFKYKPILW